jgi:hypothetical protein
MPQLNRGVRAIFSVIMISLLILTSCQNTPAETGANPPVMTDAGSSSTEPVKTTTATEAAPAADNTPASEDEPGVQATPEPSGGTEEAPQTETPAAPTPAAVLDDWREAPIVPETVSQRVLDIYQNGQAQGRDPHSFSVIGDCQSIPYVFMGPFGRGELEPDPSESHLWNAINYFEGSFKRWSVTARGGFTAASILNPLQADQHECKPGETPLTCEFRLNNPAYVLITLETWLDPDTIDRYEVYLRQILNTVIEKGAIPILLTKADSSELRDGTHVINPVVVKLAYEYNVPVVNFWRAAQYLDNYGIDPEREGFHLSQAGYNLKNILALRALYLVWHTVEGDKKAESAATEAQPTPTATATSTPHPGPRITVPDCGAGCVFFGAVASQDGQRVPQGVFAYAPETGTLTRVLGEGFNLQDVSENGQLLLVNQAERLYTVDLSKQTSSLVSESFLFSGQLGAYWQEGDEEIIYLDAENPILTDRGQAFSLYPSPFNANLFFESGGCDLSHFCQTEGVYQIGPDGEPILMESFAQPVFSPAGHYVAFLNPAAATDENYHHISYLLLEETARGIASRRTLFLPDEAGFMVFPEVENYAFSPAENKLLILFNVYSEYYEKSLRLQTYLWNLENGILYDFGKVEGASGALNPRLVWSPDGDSILFFLTETTEANGFTIHVYRTDLETGEKMSPLEENILSSQDYLYITNLYWVE